MAYKSIIVPYGIDYDLAKNITILQSAIDAEIHLAHSCKRGSCGACKARLIKGIVSQPAGLRGLSDEERETGFILTCAAIPESDICLEANYYPELAGIKVGIYPCKVDSIEYPAQDIAILKTRLAPGNQFKYLPGQYVDIIYKEIRRSYSIANIQQGALGLEFHIRIVANGEFSGNVVGLLKQNDLLRFEGPIGTFYYRDSLSPLILVAGGTGFAPIKAIIEHLLIQKSTRKIYLYWGSRTIEGFYSELPNYWQKTNDNIIYTPVLSGDYPEWSGRRGLVHKAVVEDIGDLSGFDVYVCGSQNMVDVARKDFIINGLSQDHLYTDTFVFSR